MQYLLDSDICISLLRNKFQINAKIKSVDINNCFISEITVAELVYGAHYSGDFAKHRAEATEIATLFSVIPVFDSFDIFGQEKARLRRAGILIPDFDLLIGTTAVHHNLVMVTNNEQHLNRINRIKIENWRKQAFNEFLK